MRLKSRCESDELLAMRYLNKRMELTKEEKFYYANLEKGYEGEVKFDLLAESLKEERYIIDDLLLNVNNSYFQIDNLIISQGVINLLDIKNYESDFYWESDKLYARKANREYKNPVDQLKRCTTLFRQLLHNLNLNYLVDATVIFINSEFTLYQAPMDQPFILSTQVNRFLKDLNETPSKLNDGHMKLAQTLLSKHQTKNPFTKYPKYNYQQLKKGMTCAICLSFAISVVGQKCICKDCGHTELVSAALIRSVNELKFLFPEIKITTNIVYDWCKVIHSKQRIATILAKNYKIVGIHQWAYYE
jgi:hypothetical protein